MATSATQAHTNVSLHKENLTFTAHCGIIKYSLPESSTNVHGIPGAVLFVKKNEMSISEEIHLPFNYIKYVKLVVVKTEKRNVTNIVVLMATAVKLIINLNIFFSNSVK